MPEFLGSFGDLHLFSNDTRAVIINSTNNLVMSSGNVNVLKLSQPGWEPAISIDAVTLELANAALSTLDVSITASGARMYTVPQTVQDEAQKALEWRKEHNRGGTSVGLNTARTLAKGGQIGLKKVRHIAKYFARHEVDKKGKGYKPGEDGFPSNGRIAWALWGGDGAWRWAKTIVERENKKSLTADGYPTPMYEPIYISPTTDLADFDLARKVDDDSLAPTFIARVAHDGTGVDRLYKVDLNNRTYMWDDGQWDDFGGGNTDIWSIDEELDDFTTYVDRTHLEIDPDSAIAVASLFEYRPGQPASLEDINFEEASLVAAAINEIDWNFIDGLTAAGEPTPVTNQDGIYTPEERAQKASKQVRDATGKFAKTGSRVSVDKDPSKSGVIVSINPANGTVGVKLDSGPTIDVGGKSVGPEQAKPVAQAPTPAKAEAPALDTTGILGQPRDIGGPAARLPGTLPQLSPQDLQQILRDWPAWVQSQRQNYTPIETPTVPVQDPSTRGIGQYGRNLEKRTGQKYQTNPGYHPLLKKWLQGRNKTTGTRNNLWFSPITSAAGEPEKELTPSTSDVQPMYLAFVDAEDPRAVLKVVSLIPASSQSSQPMTYKREGGKWVRDPQSITELNSATPPPVVPLDETVLNDVLIQVDLAQGVEKKEEASEAPIAASLALAVLFGPNVPITAAGGLDRNRGNAEELRRYWTVGKGGLKIRWGTGGDWTRCVRNLRKYMGPRAKGYCALRHKEMNGVWPGDRRNRETGIIDDATFLSTEEQIITAAALRADRDEQVLRLQALRAGGAMQTVGDDYNSSTYNYFNYEPFDISEKIREAVEKGDSDDIQEIMIIDLVPTQKSVNMRRVGKNYLSEKPVKVWKDADGYKLIDGHHRCVGHMLNGHDYIKAKVFSATTPEDGEQ